MLLKLIKTRQCISGAHCELWEIIPGASFQRNGRSGLRRERSNCENGRLLAKVFVLNEHLPIELIFRLTVHHSGIFIQSRQCGWQWNDPTEEQSVTDYLLSVQAIHEEIRIEVCVPEPYLPGYPHVDRNPHDYPIVFGDFD